MSRINGESMFGFSRGFEALLAAAYDAKRVAPATDFKSRVRFGCYRRPGLPPIDRYA